MYGIVLNEEQHKYVKDNWSEEDLPIIDYVEGDPKTKNHIVLYDGVGSGHPTVFGKVLGKVSQHGDELDLRKIDIPTYGDQQEVRKHFLLCFPENIRFENNIEMMLVTHYS